MGRRALQLKSVWDPIQLLQAFAEHGIRPKHAQKIWSFLIRHPAAHWNDVPDLPKAAIRILDEQFSKFITKVVECQNSEDGETTKLLLELQDGLQIEAVIMHYDTTARFAHEEGADAMLDEPACSSAASCADSVVTGAGTLGGRGHRRATLCVSSQVGCQMGCTFCATGTMGLKGNLTAGEIVEQLVHANSISKIRNIVFMGMGEPLNNYEAVRAAIASMVDPTQWGLSRQRVTVSTVGVVNRVKQLGQDLPGIGLALSLHAPNQDLRIQIVPSAKAYHIDKLIESVAAYQHLSKQRIFVEYVLLAGVNDGMEHALQLGALLSGLKVLLNLIPWNPVLAAKEAHDYSAPSQESILQFQSIVRTHYNVPTTVRQEKGQDISGACGQLALEKAAAVEKGALGGSRDVRTSAANRGGGAAAASNGGGGGGAGAVVDLQLQSKGGVDSGAGGEAGRGAQVGVEQGKGGAERRAQERVEVQSRGGAKDAGAGSSGKGSRRGGLIGGLVGGVGGLLGGLFWRGTPAVGNAAGSTATEESGNTTALHESKRGISAPTADNTAGAAATERSGDAIAKHESKEAAGASSSSTTTQNHSSTAGRCCGAEASTACCMQGAGVSRSDCNQTGAMPNSDSMPGISIGIVATSCKGENKGQPDTASSSQQGVGSSSSRTGADATKQMDLSEGLSEGSKPPVLRDIEELH